MPPVKKVAVIGAGASGLPAIKCCVDEGLEPVCFERTDHIGGLWHYTDSVVDHQACVMKSTVINTSKEMMSYSDYPIPKEYAVFMHNSSVLKYFHLYADKFDLRKYIQFKTEVVYVKKNENYSKTGQWDLRIKNLETGKEEDLVFDAVMICTGHHAEKNEPKFTGLENFKGKIVHSHDYKDSKGYEKKRIVVIGIGNSGGDASVDLSRVASQVFLSTRRGSWVQNRVADNGRPIDMVLSTKFFRTLLHVLPWFVTNWYFRYRLNFRFDHAMYALEPNHSPTSQHVTVNDDLPNRLVSGAIIVKPNIKVISENSVEFDDGTKEDNIDVVYLATGYIFGFPFLDKSVLEVKQNKVDLYKYVFPPDLEHQTLAIIGCIQPIGAVMPISENQCRLFTRVIKGFVKLPSSSEMWNDIHLKADTMAKRYVKSQRHTIQVDYVDYMDELAQIAGHRPDLFSLLKEDPQLALTCYFGACTPYQYRLSGPNAWGGAREAILTQWDRTCYPLKTRPLGFEKTPQTLIALYVVLAIFIAFLINFIFLS